MNSVSLYYRFLIRFHENFSMNHLTFLVSKPFLVSKFSLISLSAFGRSCYTCKVLQKFWLSTLFLSIVIQKSSGIIPTRSRNIWLTFITKFRTPRSSTFLRFCRRSVRESSVKWKRDFAVNFERIKSLFRF